MVKVFGCKYGLYTRMNKEIKIRKDIVRITGRVDVVTKLMAEGERVWGFGTHLCMYGCMDKSFWICIYHSHQSFLFYMSVASVIHQTKKPHVCAPPSTRLKMRLLSSASSLPSG